MLTYNYTLTDTNNQKITVKTLKQACNLAGIPQTRINLYTRTNRVSPKGYTIEKIAVYVPTANHHLRKPVKFVHTETGEELVFESRSEAVAHFKISIGYIYTLLNTTVTINGYKAIDLAPPKKFKSIKNYTKPVLLIKGDEKLAFLSRQEASYFLNIPSGSFGQAIRNGWKLGGYEVENISEKEYEELHKVLSKTVGI